MKSVVVILLEEFFKYEAWEWVRMAVKYKMLHLVLMRRRVQGNTLYMYEQFGLDGKLYVEVIVTLCFMAKHQNGPNNHSHQVWCMRKKVHVAGFLLD